MNHFPAQANCSWQELARTLVEVRWSSDAKHIAGIVCPSVNSVSLLRPLSHVPCCVLFRTAANSVWMLRTTGHVWTEERIATAVRLPRSLHEQLHAAADERQVAANLLVVKALETFLAQLTPVDELALVREARGPVSQATGTVGE